jgi:hypothetical protein
LLETCATRRLLPGVRALALGRRRARALAWGARAGLGCACWPGVRVLCWGARWPGRA